MAGPEQACMASSFKDGQGGHMELTARWEARHREVQEVLDSLEKGDVAEESTGRVVLGVAGQVANALYLLLSLAHLSLIYVQSVSTATDGSLFLLLSGLQVVLAFEATVYAAGGFSISKAALEMAGRIRLLLGATAWAWLVPWAAELNCRCNAEPKESSHPASSTALLAHGAAGAATRLHLGFLCEWFFRSPGDLRYPTGRTSLCAGQVAKATLW